MQDLDEGKEILAHGTSVLCFLLIQLICKKQHLVQYLTQLKDLC